MARKPHLYHYIYKTTCKINGKFYIGMHSTSNLEDGYIGSGKRLWNSIRKHGKENHEIEILEWFSDRSSLKEREREIVNERMIQDPMCMNLKIGGEGGGGTTNWSIETRKAVSRKGLKRRQEVQLSKEYREKMSNSLKESIKNGRHDTATWKGKKLSESHRKSIGESNSLSQKGEKNSQYGTIWITDGTVNKKLNKSSPIPEGWRRGRIS